MATAPEEMRVKRGPKGVTQLKIRIRSERRTGIKALGNSCLMR
jgi:hypothetical protein